MSVGDWGRPRRPGPWDNRGHCLVCERRPLRLWIKAGQCGEGARSSCLQGHPCELGQGGGPSLHTPVTLAEGGVHQAGAPWSPGLCSLPMALTP